MSVQAVSLVRGGVAHEFTPEGGGTWLLTLRGPRGDEPGGHWASAEVARHVVDAIFDTEPIIESPTGGAG
jgi:hypothetical protein